MNILRSLCPVILIATAVLPVPAQQQSGARGIYIEGARPALRFYVALERDGHTSNVSADYAFHSGDRMKFQFDVNKDSYVYVLHTTVDGDAAKVERYAGTRGIEVIRQDDRNRKTDSWDLLFPNSGSGRDNLIKANALTSIPSAPGQFFKMDEKPGLEKLTIVAAPRPLGLEAYFDTTSGKMHEGAGDEIRNRLTRSLMDYSGNSIVDSATRGIEIVEGYAGSKDSAKPIVVVVDLRHVK
jgi:hypothetical protein